MSPFCYTIIIVVTLKKQKETHMKNNNLHNANYYLNNLIIALKSVLYKRTCLFFSEIILGTILVCGTVSQWIKAVQLQKKFRKEYHHLQRLGYFDSPLQLQYAQWVIEQTIRFLPESACFIIACDDTPIKRYGNKIQGCSWHYHQSNGNRNSDLFYGYPLVVLSLIIEHPVYGTISIPLANRLYVSQKALDKIPENIRPEFKTKIELLIEMVEGIAESLKSYNKPIILLFDRGYVSQSVFEKMNYLGVKIITRFKSNVNLYSLPENSTEVRRGRPRKYGEKFKLTDIVNNKRCRIKQSVIPLYGREAIVEWKTCIAVSHLTDRSPIRIVVSRIIDISKDSCGHLVQHEGSWGMFISTDLNHDEQFILEQYSRRFSIEEMFKDLKEVCGLGKQQVRNFNSVKATTDLTLMSYTLVEFWSWDKSASELTQNRGIWDDPNRRPSHKNKRQAMQFELLWQDFSAVYARDLNPKKMRQLKNNMLELLLTS